MVGTVSQDNEFCLPFDIPPLDLGPLNAFDPYEISLPLPTSVTPASINPLSNFDWSLSEFLSLPSQSVLNADGKLQDFLNIFPCHDGPLDPLTMNHNANRFHNDAHDTIFVDRAAKEKQLLEMKEAARRLEEELTTS